MNLRCTSLSSGTLSLARVIVLAVALAGLLFSSSPLPGQEVPSPTPAHASSGGYPKGVGIEKAFECLRFERPILLTHAGDGSDRIFVVEQAGVVRVFQNGEAPSSSSVFLDISDRISRAGNEEGLLGLAFHPDFKNNGQLFVHYSSAVKDMTSIVARYRRSKEDPTLADPDSEEILLEQKQPYRNHNGGAIEFGPDGLLYISLGDGGKANDPHGHGQNLKTLLGSILRIDVDRKQDDLNYAIPADNPFVAASDTLPGARAEIWAYGLRNVWRFSFDRATGQLWAADVGQNRFEDVNLIVKGGNYGWNRFEADKIFNKNTTLAAGEHVPPVASYSHHWGLSITGGNVYRGARYPELDGTYFYGDYVSGNLWGLKQNARGDYEGRLVRRTGRSIASFGEDQQGEVFLCSFDGFIYRIVPAATPEETFKDWAGKLSETDIFSSIKQQTFSDDYHRYEVNAPFWSDTAIKHRYFRLPDGAKLGYRADGTWEIPVGGKIVKHFQQVNKKPIETRVIIRTNAGWESATYVWNRKGTDATLVPDGKQFEIWRQVNGQKKWAPMTWHAPSSSECASCHTDAAGYVLGLNTAQLNRTQEGQDTNQISQWIESGILDIDQFDPGLANRYCFPFDESVDLEMRSRVLLEVNCAMCHRPNGPGNASIDLRYASTLGQTKTVGVKPAQTDLGIEGGLLIAPGDPDKSLLLHRMKTLGQGRMPTIGSNLVDHQGVDLIEQWIRGLADHPDKR